MPDQVGVHVQVPLEGLIRPVAAVLLLVVVYRKAQLFQVAHRPGAGVVVVGAQRTDQPLDLLGIVREEVRLVRTLVVDLTHRAAEVEPGVRLRQPQPHAAQLDVDIDRMQQRKVQAVDDADRLQPAAVLQDHGVIGIALGRLDQRHAELIRRVAAGDLGRLDGLAGDGGRP